MDLTILSAKLKDLPAGAVRYFDQGRTRRLAYSGLWDQVERTRRELAALGVSSGTHVGLLAENRVEWIVVDLALIDLGAINVALPPQQFETESLAAIADRFALQLIITDRGVAEGGPEPWVVPIVRIGGELSQHELRRPTPTSELHKRFGAVIDDVYSLVFSSGTSGTLKCLVVSRRGTEAQIALFGKLGSFEPDDGILVFLPLSNFQQRWMVYTAIEYGFDIHLVDAPGLFRGFEELKPTIVAGPPLLYENIERRYRNLPAWQRGVLYAMSAVVRTALPESLARHALARLFAPLHRALGGRIRLMLVGSAPSKRATLDFYEMVGLPLYEGYGLTETGYLSLNLPGQNRIGTVGQQCVEGRLEFAEDGEIIACADAPLTYGYLGISEAEERQTYEARGRVRTGDVGHLGADGYLLLAGRKKEILITRGGYKVHPETLERVIEESPLVHHAVVFGGESIAGLSMLVALHEDDPRSYARLRARVDKLNELAPGPARISRVVFTAEEFTPQNGLLTRNLKVDRRAVMARFEDQILGVVS